MLQSEILDEWNKNQAQSKKKLTKHQLQVGWMEELIQMTEDDRTLFLLIKSILFESKVI